MPLLSGTCLGPYEIQSQLGAGGMGEVYKAQDTRLDRPVAIKVLPAHVADDPDLRQRFEREAKTISSLNHPHICTLHDIGQQDGIDYLVMEYLDGETLAQRLTKGPLPTDQVLRYATEIADALDKAHRKGITHRDLKPGNIMLTKAGTKLLDFGLAKLRDPKTAGLGLSQLPTQSASLTGEGKILGTLQYMAPEQLEGKPVDHRTDIFAFGAVVYEMATGQKAFKGDSQASLIGSILKDEPPPVSTLQPMTPPAFDHVVKTCLAKRPDDRWQSAGDVGRHLTWIIEGGSQPSVAVSVAGTAQRASWQQTMPWMLMTLVVGLAVGGLSVWSLSPVTPSRLERFIIRPPAPETVGVASRSHDIAISPDGTRVVYTATGGSPFQLYVRTVDELLATPLQGLDNLVFGPFVSPDSAWVGFAHESDDTLKKVSIRGGPPVTICTLGAPDMWGASWGPDDTIIFGTSTPSGLWRVSSDGGEPQELTARDEEQGQANHAWPDILPGGRAVLFTILTGGVIDNAQIALLDLDTGEQRVLVPGGSNPHYSPTGHIVYGVGGTLRAVAFDLGRLVVTDPTPVPVLDGVVTKASGAVDFDLARDGSLVYVAGEGTAGEIERTLIWVDREGREEPLALSPREYGSTRLSPDGTRVAVAINDPEGDIWASELARGTLSRVTTDEAQDGNPLWTPDGERVVFTSEREGPFGLFSKASDGTGDVERLMTFDEGVFVTAGSWSPDGLTLAFTYGAAQPDLGVLSLEGEPTWEPLLQSEAFETNPAISPDGRWVAYQSNETGEPEIYVQRFPELGQRTPVSTGGGVLPRWSPDGRELFYVNGAALMVVPVETEPIFNPGTPATVFEGGPELLTPGGDLFFQDISPDGQRFLIIKPGAATGDDAAPQAQIILVQNWDEELKRLVPVD